MAVHIDEGRRHPGSTGVDALGAAYLDPGFDGLNSTILDQDIGLAVEVARRVQDPPAPK